MAGLLKNRAKVARDIQMAIEQLEEAPVAIYRKAVWDIFIRILEQTPQFTGRAVANWNIGINSPDFSFDANMGDDMELTKSGYVNNRLARERGDKKWIAEAIERNRYILRRIKRGDKVYITNATRGDDDNGKSSEAYLTDLQKAGYWSKKLRAANQPYETAIESAVLIAEGFLEAGSMPIGDLRSTTV